MDCQKTQEEILASFDGALPYESQREINQHLSTCPTCRVFAARQKALDARLSAMLVLPEVSPGFRATLRGQMRREAVLARSDSLPEIVHFVSCTVATALCVVLLPFGTSVILAAGATAASLTYIPLAALRNLFREVEEAGE
ncbi:MAG: hypothetical protein EHM23_27875 [Acidobacteria bacterium]|nr:MAG: hypothetical protein EHM23_27875 [Acidobacteriota bacterium]